VHLGALKKFVGLRARWDRGSSKQQNYSAKRYGHSFHGILHPAEPADDSTAHGLGLVT
jgi:hypothetical protein